jgi:formamidase
MKTLAIDLTKRLKQEPALGHNRWHPDIPPAISVTPGEEVLIETRDASDSQMNASITAADIAGFDGYTPHPLTGPVFIEGAKPGDLLEVEFVDIIPADYGWTATGPGLGALPDLCSEAFLAHWNIADGRATSAEVPGVTLTGAPFMGVSGIAPSQALLEKWFARESDLERRGGAAFLPIATDAVPATGPAAEHGARTVPPRENFGNVDAKQLTKGSTLILPVFVEGALYSAGDAHFAQGDGEVCITGVEMAAQHIVRFTVLSGEAERRGITMPRFRHPGMFSDGALAAPANFLATIGYPIDAEGVQYGEDHLLLAAQNALLAMIDELGERGFSPEQAYVICSVAVDLRISNLVDLPNVTVTALLPEAIFAT